MGRARRSYANPSRPVTCLLLTLVIAVVTPVLAQTGPPSLETTSRSGQKIQPADVSELPSAPEPARAAWQTQHEAANATPEASPDATEKSEVPEVPGLSGLLHGVNAGVTFSSFHDSATGWATLLQPAIGYSFSDTFAIDVTVPIYFYRLADSRSANPRPNQQLVPRRGEPGDVIFGFHAQFVPRGFDYQATISATMPTGDTTYGLSSGRATFDFSNHFEHNFAHLSPSLEIGVGDSSELVNPLVTKNYTSLGPLAHFQFGFGVPLFWGLSFDSSAYEQLPIGDQKIYSTVTRRGHTTTVVTGRSVNEDNGFINTLDIPLDDHMTLSTYYSRSLRLHDDILSLGITYVLRGTAGKEEKLK